MEKEIRQIIQSINVGQDREDAETKALSIYKMGEGTVAALLKVAGAYRRGQWPLQEKRD